MDVEGPADRVALDGARGSTDAQQNARFRSARLPAEMSSSARARSLVRGWCTEWAVTDAVPAAEMIVTELVENAVRHAGGESELSVERIDGAMIISVGDGNSEPPRIRHPGPDQPGGRGLQLVDMIARDWGVDRTPGGKRVWATVAVD